MTLARTSERKPAVAWLGLLAMLAFDAIALLSIGPASGSALYTALAALLITAMLPWALDRRQTGRVRQSVRAAALLPVGERRGLTGLWLFFGWALFITGLTGSLTQAALQNLASYLCLVGGITVVSASASAGTWDWFARHVRRIGVVRAVAAGIVIISTGFRVSGFYNARAFAITATLLLAVMVTEPNSTRAKRVVIYLLAIEVLLSGSRTATAVVVLLVAFLSVRRGRAHLFRTVGRGAVAAAVVISFAYSVPTLRERFVGGDRGAIVFGTTVNTEGRSVIWRVVSESARREPWLGHGAGSATSTVRSNIIVAGEPHNDYLRIWHDFGYVGLILWLFGYARLVVAIGRRLRKSSVQERPPHYAALFGLLALALLSITDNVVIYYYAVLPVAVVSGLSLACGRDDAAMAVERLSGVCNECGACVKFPTRS
jgi:O-antigen ligase